LTLPNLVFYRPQRWNETREQQRYELAAALYVSEQWEEAGALIEKWSFFANRSLRGAIMILTSARNRILS
jgi:hypothetical protein